MTRNEYRKMSETAEGRKELHGIMLNEVRAKMDKLVESAPEANRAACKALTDKAFENISTLGNSDIFDFFANEQLSTRDFLYYMSKYSK